MRRSRWTRLFAVVAVVALVGAACGDDDEEASTTETTDADGGDDAAPEEDFDGVVLTATEYEFDAPDEMHASTVNIRAVNDGAVAHEFALVKLGDQTSEEFFEEFDAFVAADFSGPIPGAALNGLVAPGQGDIQPGEDPIEAEISMSAGNWLLFCALNDGDTESGEEGGGGGGDEPAGRAQDEEEGGGGEGGEEDAPLPPHYQSGMFKEITVTGDAEPTAPEGQTITAIDYGFEGLEDLEAGDEFVGLNSPDSKELHFIGISDYGKDVTAEEAEASFEKELAAFAGGGGEEGGTEEEGGGGGTDDPAGQADEEEPPEGVIESEEVGGTFPLSPGYGTTFKAELKAGNTYLLFCFLSDAQGGPPHAVANKMYKAFTIA